MGRRLILAASITVKKLLPQMIDQGFRQSWIFVGVAGRSPIFPIFCMIDRSDAEARQDPWVLANGQCLVKTSL